jgi:hypothetical protein
MRGGLDKLEKAAERNGYGADTTVGFCLVWGSGSLHSATDMLLVDPLRLGAGSGEAAAGGSKWGYLADLGRLTAFIPLGRLTGIAGRALRGSAKVESTLARDIRAAASADANATRFTAEGESEGAHEGWDALAKIFRLSDSSGSHRICAWVSLYQALRHTGRYFARLEDLCEMLHIAAGRRMWQTLENSTAINQLKQLSVILQRLQIAHQAHEIDAFRKMGFGLKDALEAMVPRVGRGALVFGVKWTRATGRMLRRTEEVGHVMYAARDSKGVLHIFDRYGDVVTDLAQLEAKHPLYHGMGRASFEGVDTAIWIPEATVEEKAANVAKAIKGMGPFGALLIPIFLRPAAMPQRAAQH